MALGCSGGESGGGCGGTSATQRCDINATATVCGDQITVECFDGATPDAESQCEKALEQDGDSVYCCTSAAEEADADDDASAGGGGAAALGTET